MKKIVEKAFAITLIILSLIATFLQIEVIGDMIYAIIIPSFVLSLISFVAEISVKCETDSKELADLAYKLSDLEQKKVDGDIESYKKGEYKTPFSDGIIPDEIYQQQIESNKHMKEANNYLRTSIFCIKCGKICDKLMMFGYVLLFVSLCLSSIFIRWLSLVDLNCITLWSLTLLYFTIELKTECCNKLVTFLYKMYSKKSKKTEDEEKLEEV